MRIFVFQAATGEKVVALDQRGDDRLVRIALLASVINDSGSPTFAVRAKTRCVIGVKAGIIHRKGNSRGNAHGLDFAGLGSPDFKVIAAMAGRCMDKACTRIIGDMIALEHGNRETVATSKTREGMGELH